MLRSFSPSQFGPAKILINLPKLTIQVFQIEPGPTAERMLEVHFELKERYGDSRDPLLMALFAEPEPDPEELLESFRKIASRLLPHWPPPPIS